MEERAYRQSRLCRLLGKPLAFAVVNMLGESKELSSSEIATPLAGAYHGQVTFWRRCHWPRSSDTKPRGDRRAIV
jgi:hypothetical protein